MKKKRKLPDKPAPVDDGTTGQKGGISRRSFLKKGWSVAIAALVLPAAASLPACPLEYPDGDDYSDWDDYSDGYYGDYSDYGDWDNYYSDYSDWDNYSDYSDWDNYYSDWDDWSDDYSDD